MTAHAVELSEAVREDLAEQVARGEEIVLTENGRPVAQIVPIQRKKKRQFGSARGMIEMAPDFDEPLEEFRDYQ